MTPPGHRLCDRADSDRRFRLTSQLEPARVSLDHAVAVAGVLLALAPVRNSQRAARQLDDAGPLQHDLRGRGFAATKRVQSRTATAIEARGPGTYFDVPVGFIPK